MFCPGKLPSCQVWQPGVPGRADEGPRQPGLPADTGALFLPEPTADPGPRGLGRGQLHREWGGGQQRGGMCLSPTVPWRLLPGERGGLDFTVWERLNGEILLYFHMKIEILKKANIYIFKLKLNNYEQLKYIHDTRFLLDERLIGKDKFTAD